MKQNIPIEYLQEAKKWMNPDYFYRMIEQNGDKVLVAYTSDYLESKKCDLKKTEQRIEDLKPKKEQSNGKTRTRAR